MRSLTGLFIVTITMLVFSSCSNYGKEYKLDDRHNVFYKDGVDEETAKRLANYLKAESYFQDGITASVQALKNKDTFVVNFVVDKSKINDDREKAFKTFGGHISKNVFNSAPVTINLTDDKLNPIFKLGYTPVPEPEPAQ